MCRYLAFWPMLELHYQEFFTAIWFLGVFGGNSSGNGSASWHGIGSQSKPHRHTEVLEGQWLCGQAYTSSFTDDRAKSSKCCTCFGYPSVIFIIDVETVRKSAAQVCKLSTAARSSLFIVNTGSWYTIPGAGRYMTSVFYADGTAKTIAKCWELVQTMLLVLQCLHLVHSHRQARSHRAWWSRPLPGVVLGWTTFH